MNDDLGKKFSQLKFMLNFVKKCPQEEYVFFSDDENSKVSAEHLTVAMLWLG